MATYVPNALTETEPTESRTVESAALEFRTLKTSVTDRVDALQAELDAEQSDRIADEAALAAVDAALDVRVVAIEDALLTVNGSGLPGTVYTQRFSGTGAATIFTLAVETLVSTQVAVYIAGIYQQHNTFTVVGDVLTFSEAPLAGTNNIEVVITVTSVLDPTGPAESSAVAAAVSAAEALASENAAAASAVLATDNGAIQVALAADQVVLAEASAAAALVSEGNADTSEAAALAAQAAAEAAATYAQIGAKVYTTTALGITGTTTGQYFAVKQLYGDAIDLYLNTAGVAVYQQTRPFGMGEQYEAAQIAERNINDYPAYVYTPIVDVHSVDQYDADNSFLKNRISNGAYSKNLFPLNSGYIPGATTKSYALGPAGNLTACRFSLINTGVGIFGSALTTGISYTYRAKVKSNVGAGALNFQLGQFNTAMVTVSCDESAWTTVTWTIDGSKTNPIYLDSRYGTTTTIDILMDEIQCYEGTSIPTNFVDEVRDLSVYPMKVFSISAAEIYKDHGRTVRAGAVIDSTTGFGGMALVPTFPTAKVFTEGTMVACISTTDTATLASKITASKGGAGEWDLTNSNGFAGGAPAYPYNEAGDAGTTKLAGQGYQIVVSRFKAGEQAFFLRKVKVGLKTATITPTLQGFGVFNDPITQSGSAFTVYKFKGKATVLQVFDRWMSDAQVYDLIDNVAARHALTGEPALVPYTFWIAEGDSISATYGGGIVTHNYPEKFFQTFRGNWFGRNVAVGGSKHVNAVTRQAWVISMCEGAIADGSRPIVSYFMGANEIPTQQQVTDYGTAVRATGAKFVMCTILPKGSDATWETNRLAYNTMLRDNPQLYDGLADFGASATIGVFGAPTARVYYYDDVHLNDAGAIEATSIISPVLLSLAL